MHGAALASDAGLSSGSAPCLIHHAAWRRGNSCSDWPRAGSRDYERRASADRLRDYDHGRAVVGIQEPADRARRFRDPLSCGAAAAGLFGGSPEALDTMAGKLARVVG